MSEAPRAPAARLLTLIGGAALLSAAATDTIAVVGRHVGRPLLGSIEIVQTAVLIASSIALVVATAEKRHAVVHLLVNRLGHRWRGRVERAGASLGGLLSLAFLAGAAWTAGDMWAGHEESELLLIPFAPLRLIEIAALGSVVILFLVQAVGRRR